MNAPAAKVDAIVLVGLPGSGKSTIGPIAARMLGWRFVDLDRSIEKEAGMSAERIFADEGEKGFRVREREATTREGRERPVLIAAGGGWMLDPSNRAVLGAGAVTVYLAVTPKVAAARLGAEAARRPLLRGRPLPLALSALLEHREDVYLQANHTLTVDSLSPDESASIIVALASGQAGY